MWILCVKLAKIGQIIWGPLLTKSWICFWNSCELQMLLKAVYWKVRGNGRRKNLQFLYISQNAILLAYNNQVMGQVPFSFGGQGNERYTMQTIRLLCVILNIAMELHLIIIGRYLLVGTCHAVTMYYCRPWNSEFSKVLVGSMQIKGNMRISILSHYQITTYKIHKNEHFLHRYERNFVFTFYCSKNNVK